MVLVVLIHLPPTTVPKHCKCVWREKLDQRALFEIVQLPITDGRSKYLLKQIAQQIMNLLYLEIRHDSDPGQVCLVELPH
jgi:hypothetical protein